MYRFEYEGKTDPRRFEDLRQALIAAFVEIRNMSYEEARRNAVRYITLGLIEEGVPVNIAYGTQRDEYVTLLKEE